MTPPNPPERRPLFGAPAPKDADNGKWLSVADVNELGRRAVENAAPWVKVAAEASNVLYASSGHLYFTLKDERAQISAVMWRSAVQRMPMKIADGFAVKAEGTLTIYPARGQFQMVVERLSPAGRGSLEERLRLLKKRYADLGYFDEARKRPLPFLPRTIGVVTSKFGAAVHDILRTIADRFPPAHVVIVPVRVQGEGAAAEIAAAIARLNALEICDVMIVGRGGGSLEDLWAFNEPAVVEAIHQSAIPVISAVGHEIDVVLSDLVADRRALTPTNAGEIVVPDFDELSESIDRLARRATSLVRGELRSAKERVRSLARSWALKQPKRLVEIRMQKVDELARRMGVGLVRLRENRRRRLEVASASPAFGRVSRRIDRAKADVQAARGLMERAAAAKLADLRRRLDVLAASLGALSPERILERGYSITRGPDGAVVRDPRRVAIGATLRTQTLGGEIISEVRATDAKEADANPDRF